MTLLKKGLQEPKGRQLTAWAVCDQNKQVSKGSFEVGS